MKKTPQRARNISAKALQPLILAGRQAPSFYAVIAAEMTRRSGTEFYRQEIAAWLHENPKLRIEPRLGAGLLLLEVGTKLLGK